MKKEALYREHAKYYDVVYANKKYEKEVRFIEAVAKKYQVKDKSVLEVACGTGNHSRQFMKKGHTVVGVDKNPEVLTIARRKVPKAKYVQGDMRTFKLGKQYGILTCLFTAINYNLSIDDLVKTLRNFKRHLKDKGIIIFDFPLHKKPKTDAIFATKNLALVYESSDVGNIREVTLYWIFREKGTYATVDKDLHRLRLYSFQEYAGAIKKAGLSHKVYWDWSLHKKKGHRAIIVCQNA